VGLHAGEYKVSGADVIGLAFHHRHAGRRESACRRSPGLERGQGSDVAVWNPLQGSRRSPTQRRAEAVAPVPGRTLRRPAKVDTTALPGDVGSLGDPTSPGSAVDSCVGACPCRRTGPRFAGTCSSFAIGSMVRRHAPESAWRTARRRESSMANRPRDAVLADRANRRGDRVRTWADGLAMRSGTDLS